VLRVVTSVTSTTTSVTPYARRVTPYATATIIIYKKGKARQVLHIEALAGAWLEP
jgi:hypothetical protein